MNVAQALAAILQREGTEVLFCYPNHKVIDEASLLGIRPVVVRQERSGIHMADGYSRMHGGRKIGVFAMQHGPGTENSYGAVAQAYADSVPVLVLPQGYPQKISGVRPNYSAAVSMRDVAKSTEVLTVPDELPNVMRRAFSQLRNGRGGPVVVEVPKDFWARELSSSALDYSSVSTSRYAPSDEDVHRAVRLLLEARQPIIHAGQGVLVAEAWPELRELAEWMGVPVATTLPGKSAFPEDHPLSLGSGGLAYPLPLRRFLDQADLVLGVGCSFTESSFAVPIPQGKKVIHQTLDPSHLDKDVRCDVGLIGDARLALRALIDGLKAAGRTQAKSWPVAAQIEDLRATWLAEWQARLDADSVPISPYRVVSELMRATAQEDVVITHDAGRPRDQLTPFWMSRTPRSFIGWGKTTQLGYGLPLILGARLARPQSLCINVWGDAAIGFTGTELETAVRERLPMLSILLNNGGMATELNALPEAIRLFKATDIGGNYADFARSLGCQAERITDPALIGPALRRGIESVKAGRVVLLEFMTSMETAYSVPK